MSSPYFILHMSQQLKYQVIFSDVDGTLLNKNRELSEFTIQQIRKTITAHKVKFVMVSARMPEGMKYLYDQLSVESPIICYNGALILKDMHKGFNPSNVIHSNSIDYKTTKQLYKRIKPENLHFGLFSNNSWFANQHDEWTLKEENNTRVKCTIRQDFDDLITELEASHQPIHKIMVMGTAVKMDAIIEFSNQNFQKSVTNYRSKDNYIEISPIESNKANGCVLLMNHLGIQQSNSIAFGDNYNDIEMLKMAGIGIAMENAPEEVKKYAKQITLSNLSEGVAVSIEKIFG